MRDLRDTLIPHPAWRAIWPAALITLPVGLPAASLYLYAHHHNVKARWLVVFACAVLAAMTAANATGIDTEALGQGWPPEDGDAAQWATTTLAATIAGLPWGALLAAAIQWGMPKLQPALKPTGRALAIARDIFDDAREQAFDAAGRLVAAAASAPTAVATPGPTGPPSTGDRTGRSVDSADAAVGGMVRLGTDTTTGDAAGVTFDELQAHTLLLGATGSGKTTSLLRIIDGAAQLGIPVVAIDLKGSPGFHDQFAKIADRVGRRLVSWSLSGQSHWNPLARGDASELKDKLIGMETWTEPHYKRAAERYLQTVFTVLEARGERPSMDRVVALMDAKALNAELRKIPKDIADRVAAYLDQLTDSRDQRSAIAGLATRLALLSESVSGRRLTSHSNADSTIDIGASIRAGDLCLFSLDSLRYAEFAAQVAGLVLQDLKTVASELLAAGGCRALVAIDEFSALDGDQLLGLLARAREAEIGVLLSTQELADLAKVDPTFADQVIANTNVKLIHRQDVPESAERLASMIGTYSDWEHTYAEHDPLAELFTGSISTITGTRRIVEKFKVHPNTFKNLHTGQAVVSIKSPEPMAGVVSIAPPHTSPVDPAAVADSVAMPQRRLAPPPESQPAMPQTPPTGLHTLGQITGRLLDGTAQGRNR